MLVVPENGAIRSAKKIDIYSPPRIAQNSISLLIFLVLPSMYFSPAIHHIIMQQEKQQKPKKFQPHFPTTKIKKIIQENQDIGKLSNLVPPLVQQSLEFFLVDLLKKCEDLAKDYSVSKLTPPMLKKALLELDSYEFLKDALDDVEDMPGPKASASKASAAHSGKRARPEPQVKQEKSLPKKGRKKAKKEQEEIDPISVDDS